MAYNLAMTFWEHLEELRRRIIISAVAVVVFSIASLSFSQPIEKLLPKAGNSIYKLILMASRRATELADGQPMLVEHPTSHKVTTIALDEIIAGKVVLKNHAAPKEKKGA